MTYDSEVSTYDDLPRVGSRYGPTHVTGMVGLDSYGLERIRCGWRDVWFVLCFSSGLDDARVWEVVAVIPEDQGRHIARWFMEVYL